MTTEVTILDTVPASPVLTGPNAAAYLGTSNSNFQKLVKAGKMPAPIRLASQRPVWRLADLNNFIASL